MTVMTALVIEDDPDALKIFQKILNLEGFEVTIQSQGDTAIQYLTKNEPHLILLDMHLPVMSGHEVMKSIRAQDHLKETVVIIVSADHAMSSANAEQADYTMLKPIDSALLKQLVSRIKSTLKNKTSSK